MTWQEELRNLDEEFSSGRITADEYRVRRDHVLSSAVAPDQQSPPQNNPSADATQIVAPVSPPAGVPRQPAQPPAQWQEPDERTQAVPWHGEQSAPYSAPGVPGTPPPIYTQPGVHSPAAGFPQPGVHSPAAGFPRPEQGWNAPEPDNSAPWGGEFPPPLPTDTDWIAQGPEDERKSGAKGIVMIAIALLLVAGLAIGAFLLLSDSDTGDAQRPQGGTGGQTNEEVPAAPEPPVDNADDELKVAELPGEVHQTRHIQAFPDAVEAGFLTEDETDAYEEAGADEVRFTSAVLPSGVSAYVFTVATESSESATSAREELADLQLQYGMEELEQSPDDVVAAEIESEGDRPATLRAHYTHGATVVRIQLHGDNLDDVRAAFDDIIAMQLEALEATD